MAYPIDTSPACSFLGYTAEVDFSVENRGGVIILHWYHVDPKPTDTAVNNALADLTTVNGQVYSEWAAEHGGNANLTARREALDGELAVVAGTPHAVRAELADRNTRDNYLTTRLIELQSRCDYLETQITAIKNSVGPADNIRAAIATAYPTSSATATRTRADARTSWRDAVNAGDGDV